MCTKTTFLSTIMLLLSMVPLHIWATHNRAGEIHIEQIGPLTIRATIITWTKTSSFNVDRDTLPINWGNGSPIENVPRSNGNGLPYPNDVKYNTYVAIHTYAGQVTYTISMTDPNRVTGIINVNPPSSDLIPFYIETVYSFQEPLFGGENTTPYLLQPPIDEACVGKPFKHNPNASDPDDDSLSFHLVVPLQAPGENVPNFSFPNQISPGPNNLITIDATKGDLIWQTPQIAGLYNIAIAVISWRNKVPIDTTIRDMQIFVSNCNNNPPVVQAPDEICVVAGQTVHFNVIATDPDTTDKVRLTALGAPLTSPYSPAVFTAPAGYVDPPVMGEFSWVTACEHISNQPYSVVFKATDTVSNTIPQLSDLKTVTIKVVGPAPEDFEAVASTGQVELSWLLPYVCEQTENNLFYGFSVWRREGSNPFVPDTCMPGMVGKGYTELVYITKETKDGRYYYKDTNVQRGRTYCYRVEAKFAKISAGGFPYNIVEGLPSPEVCAQLPRDIPVMVKSSVLTTDPISGAIEVCWTKPLPDDLDTILNPGPYRYQLLRGDGFTGANGFVELPGANFTAASFYLANDTCFTDNSLQTSTQPYAYKVAFYTAGNNTPLGITNSASTVYLTVSPTDQKNVLTWNEEVPWGNYQYEIYRLNTGTGLFDLLGTSNTQKYEDKNLENGVSYCYKIRSVGSYGVGGITSPLYNWSQESCGTPQDDVPPCAPVVAVNNLCISGEPVAEPDPPYENELSWNNPNTTCPGTTDVAGYRIWYSANPNDTPEVIGEVTGAENTMFIHELPSGLAGCYAISAYDVVGNESATGATVCVDNCVEYLLPNTFTPNNDNHNDVFKPFPGWRFIDRVDFQVFNRWGNLVFSTQDPALNWDGTTSDGKKVADGTYYYVCKVFVTNLAGDNVNTGILSGWIEVVAGN